MKHLSIYLLAFSAALFFCSCSKSDDGCSCSCSCSCSKPNDDSSEVVYKESGVGISTYQALINGYMYGFHFVERFHLVLGYNESDSFLVINETYASFEVYSDNELKFIGEHVDSSGRLNIMNDNFPVTFFPIIPGYYCSQSLPVAASGVGTYLFALKFYQPQTDSYFITPRYQMKLWYEDDLLKTSIRLADN